MLKVLKALFLLLLITAMVWLSTLWRWQTTNTDPSAQDVVLHLVLLPLALTGVLLMALWLGKKIRKTLESPVQPAAAQAAQPPLATPPEKLSTD